MSSEQHSRVASSRVNSGALRTAALLHAGSRLAPPPAQARQAARRAALLISQDATPDSCCLL